jgi:hypothetical protein
MAQNDFVIADQTASAALADINSALQSLASCSSGSSEPSVKYANQLWYDTTTHILKVRNEANSAWISVLYVHQADNAVHILDNTYISDTSGNHVGLLGDQATSEWTTGTGTTESLVSPAKIAAAISALASVTSGQVLGYIAAASVGGVGTYALMYPNNLDTYTQYNWAPGTTFSGSSLIYMGASLSNAGGGSTTSVASGTWRLMSRMQYYYTSSISWDKRITLWLRIS